MVFKKIINFLFVTVLLCAPLTVLAENWSIIRNNEHLQPKCDIGLDYVEKYGAYYVDKNASDENKVIYLRI